MTKSSIFKSYDIRGVYPDQLNEHTAFEVGRGFVKHTGATSVVVGHDARLSSLELFRSLLEGITSQGATVYSIGQVPTECLYFAVGNYGFDAGIMVTASHNPKEYNGFKMIKRTEAGIEMIRGKDLFSTIEKNSYDQKPQGSIIEKDIWQDYIIYLQKFSKGITKPFKVVVDASNGVVGKAIKEIKRLLPIEIIELNFEPDGRFGNHSPNPLEPGSSDQVKALIKAQKADFGFMFDGDADRVFLVDEEGALVSADITLLLLADYFLKITPGTAIAYNAICSKAVPEFIIKWGGAPLRTKVGFVNVREALISHGGVMGGELSGHYCFKDYFYMDSGMIAFLVLLQVLCQDERKVSVITKALSPYFKSAEMNFEIEDKEAVIQNIKERYIDGKQDHLDGITVSYKDWWFNVRPSNTEPLLRVTVEADTKELLEEKKKELQAYIM